ncbi:MAG TPA: hypothetical protein VHM90_20775 [Phycisphaerae bacterium]|nr:hypothetical protein [Phycisphaerae bacterium]
MKEPRNEIDDRPQATEAANTNPPQWELRLILLRILASSHSRWDFCGHAPCRRARMCHGRYLTCFREPFRVDIQRFLDWTD